MTQSAAREYAIHEAAHAVAAHVCGFHVKWIAIAPERKSGKCELDRGFDVDRTLYDLRNNPEPDTASQLLLRLKRDLVGRLSGMVGDELFGIQGSDEEYRKDSHAASQLEDYIRQAEWSRANPRPPFSEREALSSIDSRMREFVREEVLMPNRDTVEALASLLEQARKLRRDEIMAIFDANALTFDMIKDEQLP